MAIPISDRSEELFVKGAAGRIEVVVDLPGAAAPAGIALVAHPHPLFGGSLDNKVVQTVAKTMLELGLVSLRGQLHLCASLHGLLGASSPTNAATPDRPARMIMIRHEGESWVFTAEEVLGVPRVPPDQWQSVPSTLANPAVSFSQAVFTWQGRSVGLLDEARVFAALRSLGQ